MTWSFLLTTLIVVASPGTGVLYTLAVTYLSVLLSTRLEHGESMLEETGACCAISCGELTRDELGKVDKVRREASRAFLALPVPPSLTVCALR